MSDENEYKNAIKQLSEATDEVKKFAETSKTELKNLGKVTDETKASADKALTALTEMSARVTELEQKSTRTAGAAKVEPSDLGSRIVGSDEVKSFMADAGRSGRVSVEVKAITSAATTVGTGTDGSTSLVQADRQPGIIQVVPNIPLVIRDLLMPGQTASRMISYALETVLTNSAAETAEGAQAPESDIKFDEKNVAVATIRHFVQASKEILSDAPQLQSYINGRLTYGLKLREDQQLLNGDGTGSNLLGLMKQSVPYAPPANVTVKDQTQIDVLRLAMLQAVLAGYPATGHILNPSDWTAIELTKDSQSRYVFSNPVGISAPVLWGLPVATSLSMASGTFMTGAFRYAAQIFDRQDATVTISTEDRDNIIKGMATILAEERLALAVYRPQALINGKFSAAAPHSHSD